MWGGVYGCGIIFRLLNPTRARRRSGGGDVIAVTSGDVIFDSRLATAQLAGL